MENKVYVFLYCPCIHESAHATMSIHRTEEGAKKAMKKHKDVKLKKFNDYLKRNPHFTKYMKFGEHEDWCVKEKELLE